MKVPIKKGERRLCIRCDTDLKQVKDANDFGLGLMREESMAGLVTLQRNRHANLSLLKVCRIDMVLPHHVTHLGMSSGFLPEPALGPRFLLSLGLTKTQRLAY